MKIVSLKTSIMFFNWKMLHHSFQITLVSFTQFLTKNLRNCHHILIFVFDFVFINSDHYLLWWRGTILGSCASATFFLYPICKPSIQPRQSRNFQIHSFNIYLKSVSLNFVENQLRCELEALKFYIRFYIMLTKFVKLISIGTPVVWESKCHREFEPDWRY
jgi:hypothetical protein